MAFWSKFDNGHWTLTADGKVAARAVRRQGRWIWELESGLAGMANSLDAAMLAVGRARQQEAFRAA
jgi:hypothetical protein